MTWILKCHAFMVAIQHDHFLRISMSEYPGILDLFVRLFLHRVFRWRLMLVNSTYCTNCIKLLCVVAFM